MIVQTAQTEFTTAASERAIAQMEKLLERPEFSRARRQRALLAWLFERALREPRVAATEADIAVAVFGRQRRDYDARIDPIVRVEAGRLRARLEHYYAAAGRHDALHFTMPRGRYALAVLRRPAAPPVLAASLTGIAGRLCLDELDLPASASNDT